jgi:HrpA-like RNA helicase
LAKTEPYTDPEIKRTSLAGVILQMAVLRLPRIDRFPFPDPPQTSLIREGLRHLEDLGAMLPGGRLTREGWRLADLPIDPHIGKMLLESARSDTAAILRMLTSPDTRRREGRMESALTMFQEMATALFCMADSQERLTEYRPEGYSDDTGENISRCESMLLNEFRELLTVSRPALNRYREYTIKSFSPENLQRYRKAYEENSFIFKSPGFAEGI